MKIYNFITLICYLLIINFVASEATKASETTKAKETNNANVAKQPEVVKPNEGNKTVEAKKEEPKPIQLVPGPVSCEFKGKDNGEEYDPSKDVVIECAAKTCKVNDNGAAAAVGLLSIKAAGTYIIKGSLEGQVRIEAAPEDFIHLVLENVNIKSSEGPAIYGVSANKITITLVGENSLTDSPFINLMLN